MGTMGQTLLHLVDRRGETLPVAIRVAVEAAHRWVRRDVSPFGRRCSCWMGGKRLARQSSGRLDDIRFPHRYAFAALRGKVGEWFRGNASREIPVGMGSELEQWAGIDRSTQRGIHRTILFDQLKAKLSERDRHILVLLQQDITSPASAGRSVGCQLLSSGKGDTARQREDFYNIGR